MVTCVTALSVVISIAQLLGIDPLEDVNWHSTFAVIFVVSIMAYIIPEARRFFENEEEQEYKICPKCKTAFEEHIRICNSCNVRTVALKGFYDSQSTDYKDAS
jgi:hypothetical protein